MEKKKNYLLLVLRGCAMGAADVIPGVSGGTIAFITGIYEELIESIRSINLKALRLLGTFQLKEFWKHINGNFLISVVAGIAISIFSLAKLMKYLLETHPLYIWSFFFGLIIISALMVSREIKKWDILTITSLIVGAIIAYTITVLTPTSTPDDWWFILLSGAIAICAMILPGISGATYLFSRSCGWYSRFLSLVILVIEKLSWNDSSSINRIHGRITQQNLAMENYRY